LGSLSTPIKYLVISMMKQRRLAQGSRGMRREGRSLALGVGIGTPEPPQFQPTLKINQRLRYLGNAGGATVNITRGNLLNLYETALTATTTTRLFAAVKLKRVEVWASPDTNAGSSTLTASVEWLGVNAPSTINADSSLGMARPLHVVSEPPIDASNRWWSLTGSNETEVLFKLVYPSYAVVDIIISARLFELETPVAGDAPAGATAGTLYENFLDGITSGMLTPLNGGLVLP
jgi:hypothetical protein